MSLLLLNYKTYSNYHIGLLKKKFDKIHLKDFKKKKNLINFLKKKNKEKDNIKAIFLSFGIFYDKDVFNLLDDNCYLVSPTTSLTHLKTIDLKKNQKLIYLDRKNFGKKLANIPSTAELTVALILALYKKIYSSIKDVKKNFWNRENFVGNQLLNKKLGIIGMGRIGKIVSNIMNSFDLKIYYFDKKKIKYKKFQKKSLKYIFSNCDIISVHLDSSLSNYGIIKKKYFNMMKKKSIFINTSRGELIDENALLNVLKRGKISGAGLDVLTGDGVWENNKFRHKLVDFSKKHDNLIITPHIGGNTSEASYLTKKMIIKKLLSYF